ncbi:hypothetical protein GE107_18085 [Cohnella sp. CFH 77786]|uniref:hypothetical protein n=1 Tax=Cohnella sp. CFH 77786 TaxID=2662265 RepID=UPI001C609350|nr:hypothetical protein [Cohnella sp. CFH 77786]MBW5447968.1 hypothetical protein [Cohnella sp. CFH 77786]
MKRIIGLCMLAGSLIVSGCGASSGDQPSEAEIAAGARTPAAAEQTESANAEPAGQEPQATATAPAQPAEQPVSEPAAEEVKKEEKEAKPTSAAEKAAVENKEASSAVKDSIMEKSAGGAPEKKDDRATRAAEAVAGLKSLAKDLKQKAEDQDAAQVQSIAGEMAKNWDSVKPDVQTLAPDMVSFLGEKMAKLAELTGSDKIDMDALLQLDYQLYQGFRQLSDQLNG